MPNATSDKLYLRTMPDVQANDRAGTIASAKNTYSVGNDEKRTMDEIELHNLWRRILRELKDTKEAVDDLLTISDLARIQAFDMKARLEKPEPRRRNWVE